MALLNLNAANRIATVEMNRPEKRNAINTAMKREFVELFREIEANDDVRVVVLCGKGEKAFSAGTDMFDTVGRTPFEKRLTAQADASYTVRKCTKPVIAMVRGYALGGGFELALSCDIRLASETARFGCPEVARGWIPGGGGTQLLVHLVGEGKAAYLIYSGRTLTGREALQWGLVEEVVPDGELETRTMELAARIAGSKLETLRLAKACVKIAARASLDVGLDYERELISMCYAFPDREAAIDAFKKERGERQGQSGSLASDS